MNVITIASQKGGVGKSTTALALSCILGQNNKVLLIDMDPQGNATYSSGIENPERTITDVLGGECSPSEAVIKCKYYDLLSADKYLTNVEASDAEPMLLKEKAIKPLKSYDFIIIDTPPSLGNLSYYSLTASDYVIVPVEAGVFAMQGIMQLYETFKNIKKRQNKDLKILGILLIKYNKRTIISKSIRNSLCNYAKIINTVVFDTAVRQGIAVVEAQYKQLPLIDYAKKSKPCIDYVELSKEITERIKNYD